jgi:GNAT superfamily N-acetyltransferase
MAQAGAIVTDLALARRLERAEAAANANFVEAHARLAPEAAFTWMEVAGTYAMFDGVESPCTQTFGLGMFASPTAEDFERIEAFYRERGAATYQEVSPLADPAALDGLQSRGYKIVEMTSVMYLPLANRSAAAPPVPVRIAGPEEKQTWARTASEGWSESREYAHLIEELMRVHVANPESVQFLAEVDGEPAGAAALFVHGGVGLLAGASTIPRLRRRGAQRALLQARLDYAGRVGCDVAMMGAAPGSGSQRNAERAGFRIAYTRLKWMRALV